MLDRLTASPITGTTLFFNGPSDVLRRWNEVLPSLEGRARHYPPGLMVLWQLETAIDLAGFGTLINILGALACRPVLYLIAKSFGMNHTMTVAALALNVASAGMLVCPLSESSPLTAFFTLAVLACLVRATSGQPLTALVRD